VQARWDTGRTPVLAGLSWHRPVVIPYPSIRLLPRGNPNPNGRQAKILNLHILDETGAGVARDAPTVPWRPNVMVLPLGRAKLNNPT
jgi:hypothetical protein